MATTPTVSVFLLDGARATDRAFDYVVPEGTDCAAGAIVTVPFGKNNRPMNALVTAVREGEGAGLKTILSVSATASLTPELVDLAFFMRERTLCTLGDAVHTMIPPDALSRFSSRYYASAAARAAISYERRGGEDFGAAPEGEAENAVCVGEYTSAGVDEAVAPGLRGNEAGGEDTAAPRLDALGEDDRAVVEYLIENEGASENDLRSAFGESAVRRTASLAARGFVLRENREHESSNVRYETSFSLAIPSQDAAKMLISEGKNAIRGKLQRKLIEALLSGKKTEEELKSVGVATPRATASALVRRALVRVERREQYRNPYLAAQLAAKDAAPDKVEYSDEQQKAIEKIAAVAKKGAGAVMLHGVTGSGKTLVIKAIIDRTLAAGRGAIVLVPEIALTPQTVSVYCGYFGERVAVMHSSLSSGERYDAWRRVREGLCDVVIGTRSAVFAPVKNLGLIVIDEEQEHTYKSDTSPKYLAHDIARKRCADCSALMLLSSATPSLASYYKAKAGIYTLVTLDKRYGRASLPEVSIVDMRREVMRGNHTVYSTELIERLARMKERGGQAILFLNRRGYNSVVTCRMCGENLKCPNCSVSLTYHATSRVEEGAPGEYLAKRRESGLMMCHYCGYKCAVPPRCPECGDGNLLFMGSGTQRAAAELERAVPGIRVLRMDADNTRRKFSHESILDSFRRGEADVLLGTQMVTKGHDFPKVDLVGVLNADASLYLDDYRAGERTFAMLTQVIGRAGRAGGEGIAVVQTTNPTSDVICLASEQNYAAFYDREIALRRATAFPPFCDLAVVTVSSKDDVVLARACAALSGSLKKKLDAAYSDVQAIVYGPIEAPVYKVQSEYRMRMIVKCRLAPRSRALFRELIAEFAAAKRFTVSVDFNPSGM